MKTNRNQVGDRRNSPRIDRRRYLAGIAAGSLGGIAVNTEIAEATRQNRPQPNEPQYSKDMKKGWARGTFNKPIDPDIINDIQYRVINAVGDASAQDGPVLIDSHAEPNEGKTSNDRILGFGFKLVDGSPDIYVREEPTVVGTAELAPGQKRHEEKQAFENVKNFINKRGRYHD